MSLLRCLWGLVIAAGAVALTITGIFAGDVFRVSESWMGEEPGPFPVSAEFVRLDPRADRAQGAML